MQKQQLPKFLEILTALSEIYGTKLSPMITDLYWAALREFTIEQIEHAATNIIKTHKFSTMPKPADFIEFIAPKEDLDSRAFNAEKELIDAIAGRGEWDSFRFRDPVIALVVEQLGGWITVCNAFPRYVDQLDDQKWWLIDFRNRYKAIARLPLPKTIPMMIGLHKKNNEAAGYITDDKGQPIPLIEDGTQVIDLDHKPLFLRYDNEPGQKYLEERETLLIEGVK